MKKEALRVFSKFVVVEGKSLVNIALILDFMFF